MAYKTVCGVAKTTIALMAETIITTLVSAGWTVFDDQSGSSYKVLSSTGESGTRPPLYLKISWVSSTLLAMTLYMAWNNTTHTSTSPSYDNSTFVTNRNLWMYCNKDFLHAFQDNAGTVGAVALVGHVPKLPTVMLNKTTTASIASGSSVVITVDDASSFVVNARYQIFDPSTGYRAIFLCTATTGTTMTANTIPVAFAAGSIVGTHPMLCYAGSSFTTLAAGASVAHTTYNATWGGANSLKFDDAATSAAYLAKEMPYIGTTIKRSFYPPIMTDFNNVTPYKYREFGSFDDDNQLFLVGPVFNSTTYANISFTAANLDAIYMGLLVSSATTGSNTVTTLNDTTKTWATDEWAGKVLVCTSGTEVGQIKKIVSNTATQLTVDTDFVTIPVSGTYVIADRAYRYIVSTYGFLFREGF